MKHVWFLLLVLIAVSTGFNLKTAQGAEAKSEQVFVAAIKNQYVFGFCVQDRIELFELKRYVRKEIKAKLSEESAYGSLKTLVAVHEDELDLSSCWKKVIIYAKNFAQVRPSPYFNVLYSASDKKGYGVIGYCIHRSGVRKALLSEDGGRGMIKEKNAPNRHRAFAQKAKKELPCKEGSYLDVYFKYAPATNPVAQK